MTIHIDPPSLVQDSPELARDRSRYLAASGVALWGAQLGVIAVPLTAITTLSADARGTALLAASAALPFLILGLPVGAWLDRVRRRPVMIASNAIRTASLATIPIADWLDALTFAHLWLVVLVNGAATVFFDLGTQSHLKDLAPADQLMKVNGRLATLTQTALICAPPLAGWAAGLLSPTIALACTSAGYAWSAVWLARLRTPERRRSADAQKRRLLGDIRDGIRFVRQQPILRAVLGAGCLVNFGSASLTAVLPAYAINDLAWTESQLGLYLGAGGVGGLLGAMTATRLAGRFGAGRAVTVIGLIIAPAAAVLPLTEGSVPGYLAGAAWALIVYKIGFDAVLMTSFRQAITPSDLLGRVNGTMRVVLTGAVLAGATCAGVVAALVGTRGAITMAAAALGLVWLPIVLSPLPRIRSLTARSLTAGALNSVA